MKSNKNLLSGLFLSALVAIFSCNSKNNSETFKLHGKWLMTVTERSIFNSNLNADTSLNSLFRGISYIPDNSEWYFVNDSILIVCKLNNNTYKPDTLVYKLCQYGDTLMIASKEVVKKYAIHRMDANRFELSFGDRTVSYQLNKKP